MNEGDRADSNKSAVLALTQDINAKANAMIILITQGTAKSAPTLNVMTHTLHKAT